MYSNPPWFFTTGIANIGGNICASDSHFFLRSFLSHATMCLLFLCFSLEERNTGPSFKKKQTCRQASDLRNIFQRPLWVVSAFSEFDSKYNLFARQLAALGFQFLAEICSKCIFTHTLQWYWYGHIFHGFSQRVQAAQWYNNSWWITALSTVVLNAS